MKQLIGFSSVIMVSGTLYVYFMEADARDLDENCKAMTLSFTTFVFFQMFNALNCRSFDRSVFTLGWTSNKPLLWSISAVVLMQFCLIYVPMFQYIFSTWPLKISDLLRVLVVSSTILVFEEVRKYMAAGNHKDRYLPL
eukprot:TRINITY_DN1202_c0_g2_i2.p1 TRINITY_DN1202_c0_g2~~TRINITY_DN1202_c0_g2_i2.p1  ORF type:complete len:139 (-),score=21.24 TRINITY_DN1202_c0_g2_i2:309-725(-)